MNKKLLQLAAIAGVLCSSYRIHSFSPTNFSLPHEHYLWNSNRYNYPDYYVKGDPIGFRLSLGVNFEHGFSAEGRTDDNIKVDPYQIYGKQENIFPSDLTSLSQNAQNQIVAWTNTSILSDVSAATTAITKDGALVYEPKSILSESDLTFCAKMALPFDSLPGQLELVVILPVKFIDHKVTWTRVPPANSSSDLIPLGNMTYQPAQTVFNLIASDDNLESEKFSVNGIGDLQVLSSWKNHYNQTVGEELSSIGIFLQSGVSFNTAKTVSSKNILALPLGYDNAIGFPMSGAINLNFAKNFRLCAAGNAVIFLNDTSTRRIATMEEEGNFFLKRSLPVTKQTGALLSFCALGEVISDCKKFSAGIAYHYTKKQLDKFTSNDAHFNQDIANKMGKYQDKIAHNLIIQAGVNFKDMMESDITPKFSASLKLPLYHENFIAYKMLSLEGSVTF